MANPAYEVIKTFEKVMAEFTGAPYGVAVESCTAALHLCCVYSKVNEINEITIPRITYPSVANIIVHAGGRIRFKDNDWQKNGQYPLIPTNIIDSAKKICKDMYIPNTLMCLSFHGKKCLKIGRGGMILTDNREAVNWFKRARFDGRGECALPSDKLAMAGWNYMMTPGQAARGLELIQWLKDYNIDAPNPYLDLSEYSFYTEANRE